MEKEEGGGEVKFILKKRRDRIGGEDRCKGGGREEGR